MSVLHPQLAMHHELADVTELRPLTRDSPKFKIKYAEKNDFFVICMSTHILISKEEASSIVVVVFSFI